MPLRYIAIDQHGTTYQLFTEHPRKELLDKLRAKRASRIYREKKVGIDPQGNVFVQTIHCGYIIKGLWLTLYRVEEWTGIERKTKQKKD